MFATGEMFSAFEFDNYPEAERPNGQWTPMPRGASEEVRMTARNSVKARQRPRKANILQRSVTSFSTYAECHAGMATVVDACFAGSAHIGPKAEWRVGPAAQSCSWWPNY